MTFTEFYKLGLQNLAKFRFLLNSLQIEITLSEILGFEDIKDIQTRSIMSIGVEVGPKRCKNFFVFITFSLIRISWWHFNS